MIQETRSSAGFLFGLNTNMSLPVLMTDPLFPTNRSGIVWQKIWNRIRLQIDEEFPYKKNYVYNLTFGQYHFAEEIIDDIDANIFLMTDFDPPYVHNGIDDALHQLSIRPNVYIIGNHATDKRNRYSFWAINVEDNFIKPTEQEMFLNPDFKYDFISYNRKPTRHRVELVSQLYLLRLNQHGIITLGYEDTGYGNKAREKGWLFQLNENPPGVSLQESSGVNSIPNDIFSIGDGEIWRNHLINIVSETDQYYRKDYPFLSEKIFKPIIGLRPFIINGNPAIYEHLKEEGFETFLDYWPIRLGINSIEDYNMIPINIARILDWVRQMTRKEKQDLYKKMYPALLANREVFKRYVQKQWNIIDNLTF